MKGVVIVLGLLLLLGGGAVAGAQFVKVDLSFLDSVSGAKQFLASQMALYAGAGAAGAGLLLIIIAMATGGAKQAKAVPARHAHADKPRPAPQQQPARAAAQPAQRQAAPAPKAAPQTKQATPQPQAKSKPQESKSKPQASANPPNGSAGESPTWMQDPRLTNRKRVSDLVSINDALKAYHAKHGKYPKADGLKGFPDRGKAWIPGLSPEFIADLPRDPALSSDRNGPQYVYTSNGSDYKLLALGVSLVGGTNVEVLGVRIDPSKQNTAENACFGFWTKEFESV